MLKTILNLLIFVAVLGIQTGCLKLGTDETSSSSPPPAVKNTSKKWKGSIDLLPSKNVKVSKFLDTEFDYLVISSPDSDKYKYTYTYQTIKTVDDFSVLVKKDASYKISLYKDNKLILEQRLK